ncbi:MAG: Ig-like domain-containing protein [Cyanobacteriota bacterium]
MLNKKSIIIFSILVSNLFSCISISSLLEKSSIDSIQTSKLKSISIEPFNTVLNEGESTLLTAILYKEDDKIDNSNTNVEWFSEDKNIVDIDKYGKAKAIKSGEVGILAKYKYGNSIKRSIVKVVGKKIIDNININKNLVELKPEETFNLSATVYMADGTKNSNVVWSSSDNTIAVVDDKGNVTAKRIGLTTIVATYSLDNIYKKSVDINITKEGKKIVEEIIKPKDKTSIVEIPIPIPTSTSVLTPVPIPTPTSTIIPTTLPTPIPTNIPVFPPAATSTPIFPPTTTSTPINTSNFPPAPTPTPTSIIISTPVPTPTPINTIVTTIAGSLVGFADGTSSNAKFNQPYGIALDSIGNIFVTDSGNHKIRKITTNSVISTFAGAEEGFADGIGDNAKFNQPDSLALDNSGNIFITDVLSHKIRKITPDGIVSTFAGSVAGFADGMGTKAKFANPTGIAIDSIGNIFVSDKSNNKIRKITPDGFVSTIAGSIAGFADGAGANAKFSMPVGIAVDSTGNIFVTDSGNHKIRKITPNGIVSTIAGSVAGFADGLISDAKFNFPFGLALDISGNIFLSEPYNHRVRKITTNGVVSTIAGTSQGFVDGLISDAKFNFPLGLAIDSSRNIFVVDGGNNRIRKIQQ